MAKTYEQVRKEIDELKREAERLKQKEVDGVIARIREAMATYGLTAGDLGLNGASRRRTAAKVAAVPGKKRPSKSKYRATVKYRDDAGNTWVGRGPRPAWLRDALASGKQLSDFAL